MDRRLLNSRWPYAAAAFAMVAVFIFSQVRIVSDPRPLGSVADIASLSQRSDLNVLFVLIDTLRADRLSGYGYERETSPNIDRLAASGVRFAHNLSQSSWTKSSMASLWTGLYPARTGVLRFAHAVPPQARMPAETLREAGFRTAALWRNGWVAPNFGFNQGFEFYTSPRPGPVPPKLRRENPSIQLPGTDLDIVRSADEFLLSYGKGERWLLYLHLMDAHQYVSDEESARFGTSYSDIYDNSIHWVDRNIGALLASLARHGLLERTLIVLASDHGEAFGEHGTEGHARNLYGEVTETPLILSFPFRLEPGLVVRSATENVDIWPTVLDLLDLPPLVRADGRSLVAEIEAAARGADLVREDDPRFAQLDRTWGRTRASPQPVVAVTEGRYRGIHYATEPEQFELYDLEQDPEEQSNAAPDHPAVAARLRARVDAHLAEAEPPWEGGAPEVELDDLMLQQLRALGYKLD